MKILMRERVSGFFRNIMVFINYYFFVIVGEYCFSNEVFNIIINYNYIFCYYYIKVFLIRLFIVIIVIIVKLMNFDFGKVIY